VGTGGGGDLGAGRRGDGVGGIAGIAPGAPTVPRGLPEITSSIRSNRSLNAVWSVMDAKEQSARAAVNLSRSLSSATAGRSAASLGRRS
jgi:hypothetical protein